MGVDDTIYHRVWRGVLGELLGWPPHRVEAYCQRFYRPADMWFLHLDPLQHVSHLLVPRPRWWQPAFWWDADPGRSMRLKWELEDAARIDDRAVADGTFDWDAARDRIDAVLRASGASPLRW